MGMGKNGTVQTSATGANWVALTAQACNQVTISNDTGTDLQVKDATGNAFTVFASTYFPFFGILDASDLSVRRKDQSNTQVTASYRAEDV